MNNKVYVLIWGKKKETKMIGLLMYLLIVYDVRSEMSCSNSDYYLVYWHYVINIF